MADYQLPDELIQELLNKFPSVEVTESKVFIVPVDILLPLINELKGNPDYDFNYLTNLTAVDHKDRFEAIYNLVSLEKGYTLMLKVKITDKENPGVPSLCHLWAGANWQEREVYDLMGINFTGYPGHPTRILLDDDFEGYPLRKDFQWEGGREP